MFDDPVFCGLAVIFTFIFLLSVRSFFKILPSLGDCVLRWKGNVELEDSLQLSGSRNLVAIVLFVPLCMVAYSHDLYHPNFLDSMPHGLQLPVIVACMLTYVILRAFLNWQMEMGLYRTKTFIAANRSFISFIIILFIILFPTGAILNIFIDNKEFTRIALLHVTLLAYAFYIFRRGQIFASTCNPFTTFLYLCGLELLPTTVLVLSAKLL